MGSLSALAPLLGTPTDPDQQVTAAHVLQAIGAHEPWLAIFDNAESTEGIREYVEPLSGGHVLITSRNEEWSGLAEAVSVTQWRIEESVRFLLHRTGQTDRASAEGLAQDLGGLALALEHAASYMRAGDGIPLAEYRRIWRDKLSRVPGGHEDYQRSVAAALALSLDRLGAEAPLAYDLLCLFAWLAPDRIPRKELLEAGSGKLPPALATVFSDPDRWMDLIEELGRYSLLRRERTDGMVTGYYVHRVVQQVIRARLDVEGKQSWVATACDLVSDAFPFDSDEPEFWQACDALLPHALVLRDHVRRQDAPSSLGRMLNQASLYLRVRGRYAEARDFLELAIELALRQFGPDHPKVAVRRSNLAIILSASGEHAEALSEMEQALQIFKAKLPAGHPSIQQGERTHAILEARARGEAI